MKFLNFFLVFWLSLSLLHAQSAASSMTAFVNVNVITMEDAKVLLKQTVLIENGSIRTIGDKKTVEIPAGTTIIDGKGKYLMPGLADAHAHMLVGDEYGFKQNDYFLLHLASGVTTLRSMRNHKDHLKLREQVRKNQLLAPNLYVCAVAPSDASFGLEQIPTFVKQAKADGYDLVKYVSGLNPEQFERLGQACKEAGIPFAGHAYKGSLKPSIKVKQGSVEHYTPALSTYQDQPALFPSVMEDLKKNNIFVTPTLMFYYVNFFQIEGERLQKPNGFRYLPKSVYAAWVKDWAKKNKEFSADKESFDKFKAKGRNSLSEFNKVLKMMADNNVKLLLSGTDDGVFTVPGFSMVDEMNLYNNAGLTPYQILKASTSNVADFFNEGELWGTISVGKRADLILLDKNPLENAAHIQFLVGTMVRGKYYTKDELTKRISR